MTQKYIDITSLDLTDCRVLIREDLNVPLDKASGRITNDEKIKRALPTIRYAIEKKARVIICSHLGRPALPAFDPALSLFPVAKALEAALQQPVPLIANFETEDIPTDPGSVALLENVRFLAGETNNSEELSQKMASLCDIFVMDAFASAHRAHASTTGVALYAPISCAGPLLLKEIEALASGLDNPKRPLLAIVGGAKVSTKVGLLENLLKRVDQLIVGGGIANTFLKAQGYEVGRSLVDTKWIDQAANFWQSLAAEQVTMPMPCDVVVGDRLAEHAISTVKRVEAVSKEDSIFDVGPKTAEQYGDLIAAAGTIIWNGPVGAFEFPPFSTGTAALAQAIAQSRAYSVAGGGDTIAALDQFGVKDKISYVSTAGGAFLEWLEGQSLPALEVLARRNKFQ